MFPFRTIKIHRDQFGLLFRAGEFQRILEPGRHYLFDPFRKIEVAMLSPRSPEIVHPQLDLLIKSGALGNRAVVVDLKDHERALVWIDGRFHRVLRPGLHAFWKTFSEIKVEVIEVRPGRFEHPALPVIARTAGSDLALEFHTIEPGMVGVLYLDGKAVETLPAGRHAFWRGIAIVKVVPVDLREGVLDISGQDIMTADKVTVRFNMLTTFRVVDAVRSLTTTEDVKMVLYREAQMALRAVVGARELDALLLDKDGVVAEVAALIRPRSETLGLEIRAVGIRDIILPGDMKELMNKVISARKAAEANLIIRREETAAMRSQANTAKLLESNPTLMRMRELEVLEKITQSAELKVILSEKGLSDRIVNLL